MARKFLELTPTEQNHFSELVRVMKGSHNKDIAFKMDIIKRFDLDISDPVAFDFLMNFETSEIDLSQIQQNSNQTRPAPEATTDKNLIARTEQALKSKANKTQLTYANSDDLIVVQNRLLHAISHLTLNERRLILFLSPIIRKQLNLDPNNKKFVVMADEFMKEYGLKGGSCYTELEKTAISIQQKIIEFWNYGNNGKIESTVRLSWVTKGQYFKSKGRIELQLHDDVIEMLTVFDKATGNFWTQYQKEWIINLGTYGIVMLEMVLSSLQNKGRYSLDHLREKFDCTDSYPRFSDFKRCVIDKAIQEIHQNTPIQILYEIDKSGRHVTHLTFSYIDTTVKTVQNKTKNDDGPPRANPFVNFKMTQKQLAMFAGKIKKATGQDIDEIISELCNVHLQSKHIDFLKVLDFVPSDWYTEEEIRSHLTAEQIKEAKILKKIEADKIQENQKTQLEEDYEKILQNAEVFVMANQHRIRRNTVEQFLFEAGDYLAIIKSWKNDLMDEKSRKNFNKIDEIL